MTWSPWIMRCGLFKDAGDFGGDVQAGKSYSLSFRHATLPGRLVTVTAYPVWTEGPGDEEKTLTLEMQQELMICRDLDDPGSTEVWCDVSYVDLGERFNGVYTTVERAETAACRLVLSQTPHDITWDGIPEMPLD